MKKNNKLLKISFQQNTQRLRYTRKDMWLVAPIKTRKEVSIENKITKSNLAKILNFKTYNNSKERN